MTSISILARLEKIVGTAYLYTQTELLQKYAHDETEDLHFMPDFVVCPADVEQISQILKLCSETNTPITPRGAGTGLAGGALPVAGGGVLSLERLNRILDIDTQNLQATVEAGVITETLQNAVEALGLYYPNAPASSGTCFIGGNVNTNAGGIRTVKYGGLREYVLNLEVVLANGERIWTGANTLKNSTAYSLTQLLIGSEGTLGVITKIVLKLLPLPSCRLLLFMQFADPEKACLGVNRILAGAKVLPSALEFMEAAALRKAYAYLGESPQAWDADPKGAYLLVELDGNNQEALWADAERIHAHLQDLQSADFLVADDSQTQNAWWRVRKCIGRAVKRGTIYKEEDTVVPRAYLPDLFAKVKSVGQAYGFESVCYGHAGDGNLHINILKGALSDDFWKNILPLAIREIFEYAKQLGGTISGEHGIGWVQRPYLDIVLSPVHIQLLKGIKSAFDPSGILNPQKIY